MKIINKSRYTRSELNRLEGYAVFAFIGSCILALVWFCIDSGMYGALLLMGAVIIIPFLQISLREYFLKKDAKSSDSIAFNKAIKEIYANQPR